MRITYFKIASTFSILIIIISFQASSLLCTYDCFNCGLNSLILVSFLLYFFIVVWSIQGNKNQSSLNNYKEISKQKVPSESVFDKFNPYWSCMQVEYDNLWFYRQVLWEHWIFSLSRIGLSFELCTVVAMSATTWSLISNY